MGAFLKVGSWLKEGIDVKGKRRQVARTPNGLSPGLEVVRRDAPYCRCFGLVVVGLSKTVGCRVGQRASRFACIAVGGF